MRHLSAHLDWQIDPTLFLSKQALPEPLRGRPAHHLHRQPGRQPFNAPRQLRRWDETQHGLLSTLTWRASKALSVDGGINVERQRNGYERYRYPYAVPTDFDVPGAVSNNDRYTLNNVGAYVQAVVQATDRLKLVPACAPTASRAIPCSTPARRDRCRNYGWIHTSPSSAWCTAPRTRSASMPTGPHLPDPDRIARTGLHHLAHAAALRAFDEHGKELA